MTADSPLSNLSLLHFDKSPDYPLCSSAIRTLVADENKTMDAVWTEETKTQDDCEWSMKYRGKCYQVLNLSRVNDYKDNFQCSHPFVFRIGDRIVQPHALNSMTEKMMFHVLQVWIQTDNDFKLTFRSYWMQTRTRHQMTDWPLVVEQEVPGFFERGERIEFIAKQPSMEKNVNMSSLLLGWMQYDFGINGQRPSLETQVKPNGLKFENLPLVRFTQAHPWRQHMATFCSLEIVSSTPIKRISYAFQFGQTLSSLMKEGRQADAIIVDDGKEFIDDALGIQYTKGVVHDLWWFSKFVAKL